MKLRKTKAIILDTIDYLETDRIVTLLTFDYGLKKMFAKSAKKSIRRFGGGLEPFTIGCIEFSEKEYSTFPLLKYIDVEKEYSKIKNSLEKTFTASYINELVIIFLPINEQNINVYRLVEFFLDILESGEWRNLHLLIFEIKFLSFCGIVPRFGLCLRCKTKIKKDSSIKFTTEEGGMICSKCLKNGESLIPISARSALLGKYIKVNTIEKTLSTEISEELVTELRNRLKIFIEKYLGHPLKTTRFL